MDVTGIYSAFLCLILSRVTTAQVESPTNVSLHCHNLHNVLRWSYSQVLPEMKFKVVLHSLTNPSLSQNLSVDPPDQHVEFSLNSDLSDDYYVTVTAVIGQNESESTPGITFSYFDNSVASQKCFLDFPPVNVTALQDGSVHIRFQHPVLWLNHTLRSSRSGKPLKISQSPFNVDIVVINQNFERHYRFDCSKKVCEKELSVDPSREKHCLKISGVMRKISFQTTQEHCVMEAKQIPDKQNNSIFIITGGVVLFLAVFTLVIIMVYKKTTHPWSSTPDAMTFTSRLKQLTFGLVQEQVVVPELGPSSPTALLKTTENEDRGETEFTPTETSSPDIRARIGVSTVDEDVVCDVVEVGDGEEPGYMAGKNFDNSDEGVDETVSASDGPSGYEKRPVLVQLAPDEEAEGYRA